MAINITINGLAGLGLGCSSVKLAMQSTKDALVFMNIEDQISGPAARPWEEFHVDAHYTELLFAARTCSCSNQQGFVQTLVHQRQYS